MQSVNKVILIGRLGRDPEVRFTAGGACVANFSLATSESWKDKEGQKQEKTEWHKVVAWGKLGEIVKQYAKKGALVYAEGRIETREWTNKQGHAQRATDIVASTITILEFKNDAQSNEIVAPQRMADLSRESPLFAEEDIPF